IIVVAFATFLGGVVIVGGRLGSQNSTWNLADALSEEVEVTDPANPQAKITKMAASSSRLIALLGMLILLAVYLGIAAITLWEYGTTGCWPKSVEGSTQFLYMAAGLFAPYALNKFTSAFEAFGPKK
ncbi:MAG TPA: hypothetical protein VF678_12430, partial [bacterium]